jgi:hypothetical protein
MDSIDVDLITVNDIYSKIKHWTDGGKKVSVASISILVLEIIQFTEKISMHGEKKKKVAMEVIERLIKESDQEDKDELLVIVRMIVPDLIDTLISVDKKEMIIKTKKKLESCFMCLSR